MRQQLSTLNVLLGEFYLRTSFGYNQLLIWNWLTSTRQKTLLQSNVLASNQEKLDRYYWLRPGLINALNRWRYLACLFSRAVPGFRSCRGRTSATPEATFGRRSKLGSCFRWSTGKFSTWIIKIAVKNYKEYHQDNSCLASFARGAMV